ncbi:LacI family DNA-binding transcriptional regulator [Devosia rhodophyticola]|uniref:LacI family DNA-binding transcriptional regulator n=1 Tax=Devosia rhodophyticola TaxID=3026423 RepID=A0ABY7YYI0_9HYPH|nr:LacI family DNA-binding transcriptional regulator [Devosia rhodophyticola]WDR06070.1 LacI family DNA-binding transcriptional regulator [Devosia rhodophyticola]
MSGIRKRSSGATLRDVASDAGVSFSAVSKALRNAYGVSDSMRLRVQASAERLGYRPHAAARGLRGKTFTLGVLVSDLHNSFFSEIFGGVSDTASMAGYQAMLGVGQVQPVVENAVIDAMIDRQMDGLLLVAPSMSPADLEIVAEEVPTVVIGVHLPHATSFDTVNNDDETGARLVVRHLQEQSISDIAFFTLAGLPEARGTTLEFRERGYRDEMQLLGLQQHIQVVGASMDSGEIRSAALRLLSGKRRPRAVFCWTDYAAFEVIGVAKELGLSLPEDLVVVGYDNTPYCALPQHSLTSIDQFGQLLGQQATRLLLERVAGRTSPEHFVVKPTLVTRDSTVIIKPSVSSNL